MVNVLLGFAFALAESGLGLGAIIPGEVSISVLAASLDEPVAILVLGAAVALGATAGDHLGLLIGRLGGSRLRGSRLIARIGVDRWDKATDLVQRHGFWAVLASRLLPVVRTVMPVVAGAGGLRYRSFVLASALGAIAWSAVWVGAGAGLAASGILHHPWALVIAVLLAGAVVGCRRFVRRRRAADEPKLREPTWAPTASTTRLERVLADRPDA